MKYLLALALLPFCFLTEYFIVAQFLHVIVASWWWSVYTVLADAGNGLMMRRILDNGK